MGVGVNGSALSPVQSCKVQCIFFISDLSLSFVLEEGEGDESKTTSLDQLLIQLLLASSSYSSVASSSYSVTFCLSLCFTFFCDPCDVNVLLVNW